ncbi:MAG: cell envelope biogenesis protein OmpA [Bacteroidota bacterium]
MAQLKDILLREDRDALKKLQDTLEQEKLLSEKVSPIIQKHLDFIKENFEQEYGAHIDQLVEAKLIESQDEIVNIIYPKLDTMIKKYITASFQKLKENIEDQLKKVSRRFSWQSIIKRFTGRGPDESEVILSNLDQPEIQEIYVIQRDSGLLLGSFSKTQNIDQDVIAGMLTAIKSFVEDAFKKGQEDLEMIQYENYKIFLQNFHTYYFAVAITGSMSASEKENLSTNLIKFAEKGMPFYIDEIDDSITQQISEKLKLHFSELSLQDVQDKIAS